MNRRNFVVGLGTVATVSGVASVTAASFANAATAQADFRVVVDEELTVRRGNGYVDTDPQWSDTALTTEAEFQDAVDEDTPAVAYVNTEENDALESQLALLNDPSADHTNTFDQIYEVENNGSTSQDVGITFEFGPDAGTEDISEQDVVDLFTFTDAADNEISPTAPGDAPANTVGVAVGETEQINLVIDLTEDLAQTFTDAADGDPFSSGGADDLLDILENVNVGVDFDDTA